MKLEQGENRLFLLDETGRLAAEITFPQVEPGVWCIDHTFVSPALRGQGVAGRLVEAALKEITGSEVRVEYKDGKGSLRIDFYSESQLKAFAGLLGQYNPEKAAEAEAENAEAAEM